MKLIFKLLVHSLLILYCLICFSCSNEEDNSISGQKQKIIPITPKSEYTEQESGEWKLLKDDHLPHIKIIPKSTKDNIEVQVLGKFNDQHYIERIGIMNADNQDLAGVNLTKIQNATAILTLFPIPDSPKNKVYVKCNLHDLWTKPLLNNTE